MIPITWAIAAVLVVLLAGYAVGRRQGIKWGRKLGQAESCIYLRHQSLQEGVCKICDRTYD
ncbi:hypothetical protein [Effusibacillus consociatus]|uniref:FeoB-associated Cys-rich membrane protein n=1 Tax=Effusibacillus consociatus TaxID=1117041 RepID=A0ABV9PY74_9BACL